MAVKTVRCALALWRRDGNRIDVCNNAAANPGPAQSHQKKPPQYKEGLSLHHTREARNRRHDMKKTPRTSLEAKNEVSEIGLQPSQELIRVFFDTFIARQVYCR